MDLHQLPKLKGKQTTRRVGRGGKRGTFSGRGTKGQKARSGVKQGADFRGGDTPLWKLFPKLRGSSKKPGNDRPHPKHRFFQLRQVKPTALNLDKIERYFATGETVSLATIKEKSLVKNHVRRIKILGTGALTKPLTFSGVEFSKGTAEKITAAGGEIIGSSSGEAVSKANVGRG